MHKTMRRWKVKKKYGIQIHFKHLLSQEEHQDQDIKEQTMPAERLYNGKQHKLRVKKKMLHRYSKSFLCNRWVSAQEKDRDPCSDCHTSLYRTQAKTLLTKVQRTDNKPLPSSLKKKSQPKHKFKNWKQSKHTTQERQKATK